MKPRNNDEREVVRLRASLPVPTMEQYNWMLGQDYERAQEDFAEARKKVEHYDYYSLVTAVGDWQVVRYYLLNSKITRNGYTFGYLCEVSQRWMRLDGDGKLSLHIFEKPKHMHHCVFKMGYYKHENDLILFARGRDGERIETVRVDLTNLKIAESRGVQNKATEWHDEIVKAMNANMWRIGEAMKKAA